MHESNGTKKAIVGFLLGASAAAIACDIATGGQVHEKILDGVGHALGSIKKAGDHVQEVASQG